MKYAPDDKEEVHNMHLCTCILLVINSLISESRIEASQEDADH